MAFEADGTTPPTIVNSSVGRTREYLTANEVEELMEVSAEVDPLRAWAATMILIAFKTPRTACVRGPAICGGIRSSSIPGACTSAAANCGTPSGAIPIQGDELRALRRLQREHHHRARTVFTSERGGPMTPKSFPPH